MRDTYAYFHEDIFFQETCTKIINNICNTMTGLNLVSAAWNKALNEINCHLHQRDSIASSTRSALKKLEESKEKLYGKDCIAAIVVLQMNKLRFKDSKGDPCSFATFVSSIRNLPITRKKTLTWQTRSLLSFATHERNLLYGLILD